MNSDVVAFSNVMQVIIVSVACFTSIGLVGRVLWNLGSRVKQRDLAPPPNDDGRLQRLEHAVESIAIEVERISEGQRFTVALLSERLPRADRPDSLGVGPKRVVTPH